ncbi:MAG: valine--tRNA ligase [Planctomycetota bacterium]|nr:valine--tRNA ligase [Planctomycetota bacterium]
MAGELPKQYDPSAIEAPVYRRWLEARSFAARPDERQGRYVIMMPLPNVTGALHMGHAMDNVMQDLLTRWHRMAGDNTLWMPGTDHAGIATQAVIEKRLFELEGKTRHDIGRDAVVQRIWEWKDQYQARIIEQQQVMGCSCDWERQRFTMDRVCARAVRRAFFNMFRDGLIYRGLRLVNWDCHLQTAVADDEIVHEEVQGHFWHLRYPLIDPAAGEPEYVVVATTRPETMLGDTAVACHPDPVGALEKLIAARRDKLGSAGKRERAELEAELERLEKRRETHLPRLLQLAEMAARGRQVMLPLQERPIPLIRDVWAKPELGSGCVKITPGHDPNDHDVWTRHRDAIGIVNILNPDGTLNENAGGYAGLDRLAARPRVVEDLEKLGLVEAVEDRLVEVGHSDRSKTPIEPYFSKQWFVHMGDVEGGIVCGRGTRNEFTAPGLAQAAIDAAAGEWRSPTGRQVSFHPDPVRYRNTYLNWLAEKRDWCISRQLWWGHRIPIWWGTFPAAEIDRVLDGLRTRLDHEGVFARVTLPGGDSVVVGASTSAAELGLAKAASVDVLVCLLDGDDEASLASALEEIGLARDPDVLDTWFSSCLWPHSTLGWPDPETAPVDEGQTPTGRTDGADDSLSYYYPGSCLVTGRDIITLWVVRMVLMGLYNLGDVPFTDVFIHANILDGRGERMAKSKGNGIDPADIVEQYGADAMRYVLCDMQTGMQDIRLPVRAISPYSGELVDLATAKRGTSNLTYICPKTKKEFDVLGTMPDLPSAKLVSDRFEVGRNFCNKLWNAARFALLNLEAVSFQPRERSELFDEDRWILSRLSRAIAAVQGGLEKYNPSAALAVAREFFWLELCDWYLELIKPRMRDPGKAPLARQVLATLIDQVLRLLHPFVPFITEALWERLGEQAPQRGVEAPLEVSELLIETGWSRVHPAWADADVEERFGLLQDVVRAVRDVRSEYNVPPSGTVDCAIRASGAARETLDSLATLLAHSAGIARLTIAEEPERSKDTAVRVVRDVEVYVPGVVDLEKEKAKLLKHKEQLEKRIAGAQRKLENPNFLERAKPEVVERERQRQSELETELKGVEANLQAID